MTYSYRGRHAGLYDLFYQDKDYDNEVRIVESLLKKNGAQPGCGLLEIACGTGSHAFALEKLGFRPVACDASVDMVRVARRKALKKSSTVPFHVQDMRNLGLRKHDFAAALCLFDSIGYVKTNEALSRVLVGIRDHLRPRGVFVFDFWHAAAMLRHFDPVRVRQWNTANGEIVRISNTSLDAANQLASVTYTILELGRDGSWRRIEETQQNRFFGLQEMGCLLYSCGFQSVEFYNGFSFDQAIDDHSWHILAVAKRGETV